MAPTKIAVRGVNMEDLVQSMSPMTKQHSTATDENIDHQDKSTGFKVGDLVEAVFSEDGQMHHAFVLKDNQDGTYQVKWQDAGLGMPEESPVSSENMKYPPIPLDKLKVGQKYQGVVRSIVDFGAFVDIGAEANGLLHKSSISRKRVSDVHDFLSEGQQVEVWISRLQGSKFGLTMMEGSDGRPAKPDLTPFEWVSPQDWFEGTVHNIAPFGAFVTVTLPTGESADGLVHTSQLSNDWVKDVAREVKIGQKVMVRVVTVQPEKNKMFLSMKLASAPNRSDRPDVDFSAFEHIPSTQWMKGKVSQMTDFGAFVTVSTPDGKVTTDGLVHITQIKTGFIESVEAEVQKGQEVQVRIHSLDVAKGKLRLTMLWEDK